MYAPEKHFSTRPRQWGEYDKLRHSPRNTMPMSAEVREKPSSLHWTASPDESGTALREWLVYEGLLTLRMKRACGDAFRLQLLETQAGAGLMLARVDIRRVILWCGDHPCIYAESHLPPRALALLPALRQLGSDPLGETLQAQPGISRGPFEYATLHAPRLPRPIEETACEMLWARRSCFEFGQSRLSVAEAFLPGILELDLASITP
jgi:chorismate--pyruvate lyase